MKKLIFIVLFLLIPTLCNATNYFVRDDGDDGNTGLSDAQAWQTITKVNSFSFSAGDDVYFKCDDTWTITASLDIDFSGVNGANRTIIGAYYGSGTIGVSGNKPIFDGNYTFPPEQSDALIEVKNRSYVTVTNIKLYNSFGIMLLVDTCTYVNATTVDCEKAYNSGIAFKTSSNCIISGNTVTDVGRKRIELPGSNYPASIANTQSCSNNTISGNKVYRNWGEGIGVYHNCEDITVTGNTCYDNKVQIYSSSSKRTLIYRNLVYVTSNTTYWIDGMPGTGIGVNNEVGEVLESDACEIFGNNIAGCRRGIFVNAADPDVSATNHLVFNNTVVDCNHNFYSYVGTAQAYSGNKVKNNIFAIYDISAGLEQARVPDTGGGIDFDYNLWNSLPDSDARGTNDLAYANPLLAKTSGWRNLTADSITEDDFALREGSPAINSGTSTIGVAYDDLIDTIATTDFLTLIVTKDQDDYGSGWEVGAAIFTGGVVVEDPTSTIIKTGWADEADVVAGGGKFRYTLANTEWVVTIGADNAITTAFLAGISGSLSCATCWNLTVKANHDHSDVTRVSATVLDVDFNAEPTYDIPTNEQIDTVIPTTATVSANIINANSVQIAVVLEPSTGTQAIQSDNGAIATYGANGKIGIYE